MAAVTVNASGDATSENNGLNHLTQSTTKVSQLPKASLEASGPMGDAPQKRALEDGEEPGPKKLAPLSVSTGSVTASASSLPGMQSNNGMMSETIRLPDDLVGLIIGRGGENIMRMQRETGCRIQITQSIPGTKERPCTLSGTPEQIEVCRNMLNEIVSRSKAGTLGSNFNLAAGGLGGMNDVPDKSIEINIPPDKCGLIIGKGGETIKMLQQSLGVKMLLIQDSTENLGQAKPLRISGLQVNIDNAVNAVHQMMVQRDQQIAQQKLEREGNVMDPTQFGDNATASIIPVPKAAVGVVIGKGGDMINQIQNVTGTRIQFKPEDPNLPERMCSVSGMKDGVDNAIRRIHEIIQNVQERDGMMGGQRMGGGMGGPPGFGQWEGPNGRSGRNMGGITSEEHLVPANRTGLVIGKGGDTIKQINLQSGAHAEIQRNPPPGSDLNYKTFIIKGTPEQIKVCRQLIQEKVDAGPGGGASTPAYGRPMGGPPHQPPANAFGPPPQQQGFGGLPPASYPTQTALQAPPQAQPAPSFQQQPWSSQFQQWTPPTATTPQQNGTDPAKAAADTNAAAWQSYLQLCGQAQALQQQPAASAAPAATAVAAGTQPDYTKQWDEYLQRAGALAAVAAGGPTAQAVQQPVVATQAAPTAQPATSQATPDYSAQWAEYYRQYYGQQYAAVAAAATPGPAPAQT